VDRVGLGQATTVTQPLAYRRFVFLWLANWWDGVDLWLGQLAFPFQFAIVIVVLAPVCLGVAWAIDRAVDLVSARFTMVRDAEPPLNRTEPAPAPPLVHVRADVPAGTPAVITTSVRPADTTAEPATAVEPGSAAVQEAAPGDAQEPTSVGGRGSESGGS
jgi:hypothetical protein